MVMLGPGYGDDIQLIKAGLLEIADIIVVNKCDLPGSNRLLRDVQGELAGDKSPGEIEIVGVEAKSGKDVEELLDKLEKLDRAARDAERRAHHMHRRVLGELKRSAMLAHERALDHRLADATAKIRKARRLDGDDMRLRKIDRTIAIARAKQRLMNAFGRFRRRSTHKNSPL